MIWLILGLGLGLRLISLSQSLWLDEAINVIAVKENDLISLFISYTQVDFHPPGYFLILWLWTRVLGYSEVVVRLPSVIFGVLTIYLTFLIGKKLAGVKLGFVAALLLAVNPLHIYYSQEARMYSFAAMAVSLNFLYFVKLIKEEKRVFWGFCLSLLLVLSSDYVAYLIVPAQLVILLLIRNRQIISKWIKLTAITLLSLSWWIPFFLNQLHSGLNGASRVPGWREVVGSFGLKPLVLTYVKFIIGRISYPNNLIYLLLFLPVGLFFGYLLFRAVVKTEIKIKNLLLGAILVPIFLAWVISLFVPIYSYFRLLFVLPTFFLLLSLGLLSQPRKYQNIFLAILLIIEIICSAIYLFNPPFQREDWRGLVGFFSSQPEENVILLESNGTFAPLNYYATDRLTKPKSINPIGALGKFPAQYDKDVNIDNLLNKNQVYLVEYLVDISDPHRLVQKKLDQLGFRQSQIYNFNGVGFVYLYLR